MMRRLVLKTDAPAGEGGFTIIEVLVAAFILVLAAMAVFTGFAGAIHGIQRSREMQQGVSVAQREMERIRIMEFGEVALTAAPEPALAGGTKNPFTRVSTSGGFNLNRSGAADYKPFVTSPTGMEVEKPEVPSVGGSKMNVYRFIVCEQEIETDCVAKRIIIDVVPVPADNQSGYQHSYYELQSTVVEP
jgi:type II secretory pathway pseudopilin PulG